MSDTISEEIKASAAETDEYYPPVTALAIKSCTVDEESRKMDVTVEMYAAKAGTYRLRGLLTEASTAYTSGGASMRLAATNTVMGFFTNPNGDSVTFDTNRSTKTLSYSVVVLPEFMSEGVGGWGRLSDMSATFFTEAPYGDTGRVNNTAEVNWHGYYIDNSRQAVPGDVQSLEVTE